MLTDSPTVRREAAQLVAAVLAVGDGSGQIAREAATLLGDRVVRGQVLAVFEKGLAPSPDPAAFATAVRELVLSRAVLGALQRLLERVVAHPEVTRKASATLDALGADRDLRAAIDEFLNRW